MDEEDEAAQNKLRKRIEEEETQGTDNECCSSSCMDECCQVTTDPNRSYSSPDSWREHTDLCNIKKRYRKHRRSQLPNIVPFFDASPYIDIPFLHYGIEHIRRLGQTDYITERSLIKARLENQSLSVEEQMLASCQAEEWNRIADCAQRYEHDFGIDFKIIKPKLQVFRMHSFVKNYYGLEGWK